MDTYFFLHPNSTAESISYWLNFFFTIAFALEALLKVIALGFVTEPGSYLRDTWNQLDFFIVVSSLVDMAVEEINIPMIKIIRLLRTFRPLRFVTHNIHMRTMLKALFKSMGAICNTIIVVLVIFIMFSIVGVSFFAGKFQFCTVGLYDNSNKTMCEKAGGSWKVYDHNFDNVINGLVYLFELTTQENWPITVYQAIDCTDVDQGPKKGESWYYAYYYVIFLFVGSMFFLNLFVGVLYEKFQKVQKQETLTFQGVMLTENEMNWLDVMKLIVKAQPDYYTRTIPKAAWRKIVHDLVTSTIFEIVTSIIIVLNMIQMAMLYANASDDYITGLEIVNYIFTGLFTIELLLKLVGFGAEFWYEAWNLFDFIIVFCSYIDIVFSSLSSSSLRFLRIGPQLVRVLRVLRISRLLRLAKKYQRLQDMMEIIQLCLPSVMNVFSLLLLILFIYAILGSYMFHDVKPGNYISDFYNFNNFGSAMMLLMKMATGEDWNNFMFDCARTNDSCASGLGCGDIYAYIYFISFKLVVTFIMLNLFVLVVLELFDKYFIESNNFVNSYKDYFEKFQYQWYKLKPSHQGWMINQDKLIKFYANTEAPLGFKGEMDLNLLSKEIMKLKITRYKLKPIFNLNNNAYLI